MKTETKPQRAGTLGPVSVAALAGVSGTMRVDVQEDSLGTIFVDRGRVWVDGDVATSADTVAIVDEQADFVRIICGELNPVVAAIQGRILFRGNPELATRIILALNAAKPFGAGGAAEA